MRSRGSPLSTTCLDHARVAIAITTMCAPHCPPATHPRRHTPAHTVHPSGSTIALPCPRQRSPFLASCIPCHVAHTVHRPVPFLGRTG